MFLPIASFILSIILSACITVNPTQTARTLKPKQNYVALSVGQLRSNYQLLQGSNDNPYRFPAVGLHYRRGIVDYFDLGLRITNMSTLSLDSKYQFYRGSTEFATGLAVTYSKIQTLDTSLESNKPTILDIKVPLYISFYFSEYFVSTLTPAIIYRQIKEKNTVRSENKYVLYAGGTYGISLGKTYGVMAEYGIFKPTYASNDDNIKTYLKEFTISFFWSWDETKNRQAAEDMSDLELIENVTANEYDFLKDTNEKKKDSSTLPQL